MPLHLTRPRPRVRWWLLYVSDPRSTSPEAPIERLKSRRMALERMAELRADGCSVMGPMPLT